MSEPFPDPDFPPDQPVPPEGGSGEDIPQPDVDGWTDADVSGDRVDMSLEPVVAGTLGGAQVAVTANAFNYGGTFGPGVSITPADAAAYTSMPGLGPAGNAMVISGGIGISGERNDLTVSPSSMQARWEGDGRASVLLVEDNRVLVQADRADGVSAGMNVADGTTQIWGGVGADAGPGPFGQIYTNDFISRIESRDATGLVTALIEVQEGRTTLATHDRAITLDGDGVTIAYPGDGGKVKYNLDDRLATIEARLDALGG